MIMDTSNISAAKAAYESYYRAYYKDEVRCFVPNCKKYRRDHPNVKFLLIPKALKAAWCLAVERNCPKRVLYVCEEHVNVEQDCYNSKDGKYHLKKTANWLLTRTYYETVKSKSKIGNNKIEENQQILRELPSASTQLPHFENSSHSKMQKDMLNYYQYKLGFSERIKMVDGALPSKFACQQDKRVGDVSTSLPAIPTDRLQVIEECGNVQPNATATVQVKEEAEAVSEGPIALDMNINESNNDEMHDPNVLEDKDSISMYQDEDLLSDKTILDTDQCYACNECKETITGFRYTCVQCADWDLCGACEARAAHAAHYVLRIPSQRTDKEIQAVLAVIRHELLGEVLLLPEMTDKVEVKSEPEEPEDTAGPAAEPDPLGYSDKDDCGLDIDNIPKDSEKADHPKPRKRIRSETSHPRSERNTLTSPENRANPTLRTLGHGNSSFPHDYAKPAQNDNLNLNPNIIGLIRVPGAHHLTRGISVPTRMVTSQPPLRTQVTKKIAILRRPLVRNSPSGVMATPGLADQDTATTEVSPSTSIPEMERPTTTVERLFLKLPSGSNRGDVIKSLKSKVTVRLKRIDISK